MAKVKKLVLDARKAPAWLVSAAAREIALWRIDGGKIGQTQIFNMSKAIIQGSDITLGEGMSVISQLAKPDQELMKLVTKAATKKSPQEAKLVLFPPPPPEQMKLF
jgi:hypothetical protein